MKKIGDALSLAARVQALPPGPKMVVGILLMLLGPPAILTVSILGLHALHVTRGGWLVYLVSAAVGLSGLALLPVRGAARWVVTAAYVCAMLYVLLILSLGLACYVYGSCP